MPQKYENNLLTAIIFCEEIQVNGTQFLKYRNITNSEKCVNKFLEFAKKFPGARHVNFYQKGTKTFVKQIKF